MCGDEGSGCKQGKAVKPEDCSPEQIRECHGDSEDHPCVTSQACEHPEKLKGKKPGECSPEQIRECHGDVAEHPCV
jgi:hypothetical protein